MSVSPREVLLQSTGLTRDAWLRVIHFLDRKAQNALLQTNFALNALLIEKIIQDELLFMQDPHDQASPHQYFYEQTKARYQDQKRQYPVAFALTRAAVHQDLPRFEAKLEEFRSLNGDKWAERLKERSAPGYPVVRIIMARNNRALFDCLYVKNKYPVKMKFEDGYTAMSYALFYNAQEIAGWIIKQPGFRLSVPDMLAMIRSPHQNEALFFDLLKKISLGLPHEFIQVAVAAIDERKDSYLRAIVAAGAEKNFDVGALLQSISKSSRGFDLMYYYHQAMGTLPQFQRSYPQACGLMQGEIVKTNKRHSPDYGSLLLIAALYSPRNKAAELVKQNHRGAEEDFREGKILQLALKQKQVSFDVVRVLIDISAEYYNVMPKDGRSLYRKAILTRLLRRCEQGLSHEDTLRLARQMVRRWNPQLADFFKSKDSMNPDLYGNRVTSGDLKRLRQYHAGVADVAEKLQHYDHKGLRKCKKEAQRIFDAVEADVVERNVGVGFPLRGFEAGMILDIKNSVAEPRYARTYEFLSSKYNTALTPANIVQRVLVRKQTIFSWGVTWDFDLDPKGLAAFHEHEEWQTIEALHRWCRLYVAYETRKTESAEKCNALNSALAMLEAEFPKDQLSKEQQFAGEWLLAYLNYRKGALREAIWMQRYEKKDKQQGLPKGWGLLLKCFPKLDEYIKAHQEKLEKDSTQFVDAVMSNAQTRKVIRTSTASIPVTPPRPNSRYEEDMHDAEDFATQSVNALISENNTKSHTL